MTDIIELDSFGGYHFGGAHDIKIVEGCWFEEVETNVDNKFINKAVIITTKYEPDEAYNRTDGYFGKCWSATLTDSRNNSVLQFRFRNFGDLVVHYEKQGFKFIKK